MAVTTAFIQLLCAPSFKDLSNNIDKGTQMMSASSLKKYGCHLSCPGDLFGCNPLDNTVLSENVERFTTLVHKNEILASNYNGE